MAAAGRQDAPAAAVDDPTSSVAADDVVAVDDTADADVSPYTSNATQVARYLCNIFIIGYHKNISNVSFLKENIHPGTTSAMHLPKARSHGTKRS